MGFLFIMKSVVFYRYGQRGDGEVLSVGCVNLGGMPRVLNSVFAFFVCPIAITIGLGVLDIDWFRTRRHSEILTL